jgi:hypothetical protein
MPVCIATKPHDYRVLCARKDGDDVRSLLRIDRENQFLRVIVVAGKRFAGDVKIFSAVNF